MKNSSVLSGVCVLLLSGLSVSAVSVHVRPNRQQFFTGTEGFSVSCADVETDGWTVKRTARDGHTTKTCGKEKEDFGRLDGVSCILSSPFPLDSGVYWCENSSGQQSEQVTIIVTDLNAILEIPALPVETGSDVTLHCRYRDDSTAKAYIFKNDLTLTSVLVEEWTISAEQLSEEDQYYCYVPFFGLSPMSSLRVKGSTTSTSGPLTSSSGPGFSDPGSGSGSPGLVVRVFLKLLVISSYCVSTVLMVSNYRQRNRSSGGRTGIAMETRQRQIRDEEEYGDLSADVAIEHDF